MHNFKKRRLLRQHPTNQTVFQRVDTFLPKTASMTQASYRALRDHFPLEFPYARKRSGTSPSTYATRFPELRRELYQNEKIGIFKASRRNSRLSLYRGKFATEEPEPNQEKK